MKTPSLNDFPEYAAARGRHDALKSQKREKEARLDEVRAELERLHSFGRRSRLDEEAHALVHGSSVTAGPLPLHEEISTLEHELVVLERALKVSYANLQVLRDQASRKICAAATPEHRKLLRRVVEGAKVLAEACTVEAAFRADLQNAGVYPILLMSGQVGDLGRLEDPQSQISRFLLRCHSEGLLKLEDLPEAARAVATPRPTPQDERRPRDRKADPSIIFDVDAINRATAERARRVEANR